MKLISASIQKWTFPVVVAVVLCVSRVGFSADQENNKRGDLIPPQKPQIDPELPEYKPGEAGRVAGRILLIGSDEMSGPATLWAQEFKTLHPDAQVEVEGKGATTGAGALIEDSKNICMIDDGLSAVQAEAFEKKYGYKATLIPVFMDILAVTVHADNPVRSLTEAQLKSLFSDPAIKTWGQLGLRGEWENKPIAIHGRVQSIEGQSVYSRRYFKRTILGGGEFRGEVIPHKTSATIAEAIAKDRYAIGYLEVGALTKGIAPIAIARRAGEKPIAPDLESSYQGQYLLGRCFFLAINNKPGIPVGELHREFLRYVLSKQGQKQVVLYGDTPINSNISKEQIRRIGKE